jgi:hypothetical protein
MGGFWCCSMPRVLRSIGRRSIVGLWIAALIVFQAGWMAAIGWVGYRAIEMLGY